MQNLHLADCRSWCSNWQPVGPIQPSDMLCFIFNEAKCKSREMLVFKTAMSLLFFERAGRSGGMRPALRPGTPCWCAVLAGCRCFPPAFLFHSKPQHQDVGLELSPWRGHFALPLGQAHRKPQTRKGQGRKQL